MIINLFTASKIPEKSQNQQSTQKSAINTKQKIFLISDLCFRKFQGKKIT
jgi:hypothetical protein